MIKTIYCTILILFLLVVSYKPSFCQFNPLTNTFDSQEEILVSNSGKVLENTSQLSGVPCNPNSFFAITPSGQISEYSLIGNSVTFTSVISTSPINANLAYCNNLNGGAFSPTFYSSTPNYPSYYNGSGWVGVLPNIVHYNPGGYGNFLYYQRSLPPSAWMKRVDRYDGSNFVNVYSRLNRFMVVADLAVDNSGNVWLVSASDSLTFQSDSLYVISPSGQIIKQYGFNYNCYDAYGSFIIDSVYYIGLGSSNPTSPNTLLPITFTSTAAIIGTPIAMPSTATFWDLASCNQGAILSDVSEIKSEQFTVYPNPFTEATHILFNNEQKNVVINIFDLVGSKINSYHFSGSKLTIERGNMQSGIYVVQVIDNNNYVTNHKIVAQ